MFIYILFAYIKYALNLCIGVSILPYILCFYRTASCENIHIPLVLESEYVVEKTIHFIYYFFCQ